MPETFKESTPASPPRPNDHEQLDDKTEKTPQAMIEKLMIEKLKPFQGSFQEAVKKEDKQAVKKALDDAVAALKSLNATHDALVKSLPENYVKIISDYFTEVYINKNLESSITVWDIVIKKEGGELKVAANPRPINTDPDANPDELKQKKSPKETADKLIHDKLDYYSSQIKQAKKEDKEKILEQALIDLNSINATERSLVKSLPTNYSFIKKGYLSDNYIDKKGDLVLLFWDIEVKKDGDSLKATVTKRVFTPPEVKD